MRALVLALFAALLPSALIAQWTSQSSHTTADLLSISAPTATVAWASGEDGTVLRTADAGSTWTACTPPPSAKSLPLASVQGFDADTAIVLTGGKGDRSRVFRTGDGCKTWQLVFTNPDAEGDFRSLHRATANQVYLLGTPVENKFSMFLSQDRGQTWFIADDPGLDAEPGATIPEPSNAALTSIGPFLFFTTGGTAPRSLYTLASKCIGNAAAPTCTTAWSHTTISPAAGSPQSEPVIAGTTTTTQSGKTSVRLVALFTLSGASAQTQVAQSADGGQTWTTTAAPLPGSFRALSYSMTSRQFVAVGSSGSMRSGDFGKTWQPLASPADLAAGGWTDIAAPFAVGPGGRVGILPVP